MATATARNMDAPRSALLDELFFMTSDLLLKISLPGLQRYRDL
jgi:hypothetical protein